jgi:hypothetical protein
LCGVTAAGPSRTFGSLLARLALDGGLSPSVAVGHEGTINRARANDRFYRVADRGVDALKVRDVSAVNHRTRGLCVAGRP